MSQFHFVLNGSFNTVTTYLITLITHHQCKPQIMLQYHSYTNIRPQGVTNVMNFTVIYNILKTYFCKCTAFPGIF